MTPWQKYVRSATRKPCKKCGQRHASYVPGNVIVVSWRANRIKNDATPKELRRIADFYNGR